MKFVSFRRAARTIAAASLLSTTAFTAFSSVSAAPAANTPKVAALPAKAEATPTPKPVAKAAAPRQIVIVVADGLTPELNAFGADYIRKSLDQDDATGFQNLKSDGKLKTVDADALNSLKGILSTAQANGYKTGLVTSGDVTKVAPLFYNLPSDSGDVASALINAKFDFIAGGGRSHFLPKSSDGSSREDDKDLAAALKTAGGTPYFDVDSLNDEATGKILALQANGDLSYPLDRVQEEEAGFDDLVSQGIETLSEGNSPFVLVVHNEYLARALASKDTPAVAESYHNLDDIISELVTQQEDSDGEFGLAVLGNGGSSTPYLTATKPSDISNAYFIVSNLPLTYTSAGRKLKGASEETITDFATYEYKGWKISSADKAGIAAGTTNPEDVIRASYEPAIAIGFKDIAPAYTLWSLGIPGAESDIAAISKLAGTKPPASTKPADADVE